MTVYSTGVLRGFTKYETHYHAPSVPYTRTVDGVNVHGVVVKACHHYDIPDALLSRALAAGATTTACELGEGNE